MNAPNVTARLGTNYVTATRIEASRIAQMVDLLPAAVHAPDTPGLMRQAAVECFFVHVRTLIEFLEVRPTGDNRDRSARDTRLDAKGRPTNWRPTLDPALAARLKDDWDTTSAHLVHFSKRRVFDEQGHFVPVSTELADLEAIADDVLAVWDQYATESNHPLVPHRADFRLWR